MTIHLPEQYKTWAEDRAAILDTESETGYLDADAIHGTEDDAVEMLHTVGPVLVALAELDGHLWYDIATSLTCSEAEAIASLLRLIGRDGDAFIAAHAEGDDEGDEHYQGES